MSDIRVITLISVGHFASHFLQLTLPPLFPLLRAEFDVAWVALGLLMTVFYGASGIGQTTAGFLVDRFGARPMLLGGLALFSGAIVLAGFASTFWMLVPVMALAGLGNSVFHPADYAVFNAAINPRRLGRAYSAHGIAGSLGYAAGPVAMVALGATVGWRPAIVCAGVAGLLLAGVFAVATRGIVDHRERILAPSAGQAVALRASLGVLLTAPVLTAFAYFALLAMATAGTQTFGVAAIVALYEAPLTLAGSALTGYLVAKAFGVLAGGVVADRVPRHDLIAGGSMVFATVMMLLVASAAFTTAVLVLLMAVAGFAVGAAQPSRDLLVRSATPTGSSGKVFGFAYSGLDLGSSLTPVVFGWLLDRGEPRAIFVVIAVLLLLTVLTVTQVGRRPAAGRVPARAAAPDGLRAPARVPAREPATQPPTAR